MLKLLFHSCKFVDMLLFLLLKVSSEMAFRFRITIVNSAFVVSYLCCCQWEPEIVGLYISADHCRERITSTKIHFISRLSHFEGDDAEDEFSYTKQVRRLQAVLWPQFIATSLSCDPTVSVFCRGEFLFFT